MQDGNTNQGFIFQTGSDHTAAIKQNGNGNTSTVIQGN
jgi:hypothetical protein